MSYFTAFPQIVYDIDNSGELRVVTDIFRRIKLREKIANTSSLYFKYQLQNGDTPESIAYKHFGSAHLHWIILLTNNITDRYYGWPLNDQDFETYVNDKYDNPGAVHHYEIAQSSGATSSSDYSHLIEVNSTTTGASSVSNYEYERRLQDEKREIKLLDRKYLPIFIEEFEKQIDL
jgi:hypothetical protein